MTTPDWLTALAEKAAKAQAEPPGAETRTSLEYAEALTDLESACAPEAIAALVEVAKAAIRCARSDPSDKDVRAMEAALARLDACAAGEASGRAEAFEAAANEAYAHRDLYNGSEKHLRFRVAIEIAATIREIAKPLSPPVAEPESKP